MRRRQPRRGRDGEADEQIPIAHDEAAEVGELLDV
jgi:hypothetical protein